MHATTAKIGSHAMHRMVKRESERTIHQLELVSKFTKGKGRIYFERYHI
jgi:hypothetical protein